MPWRFFSDHRHRYLSLSAICISGMNTNSRSTEHQQSVSSDVYRLCFVFAVSFLSMNKIIKHWNNVNVTILWCWTPFMSFVYRLIRLWWLIVHSSIGQSITRNSFREASFHQEILDGFKLHKKRKIYILNYQHFAKRKKRLTANFLFEEPKGSWRG